jgi:ubiquinone/menaquinone biosynthesis C-methylase UbiE
MEQDNPDRFREEFTHGLMSTDQEYYDHLSGGEGIGMPTSITADHILELCQGDCVINGSSWLDIGCGSGRNIRPGMIGVDNCDNFLKISNSKGKDVIKGDMINLPLDDNTGIGMICIAAFHHLSTRENRLKALLEFKRVLKIGAKIMISVWSINQTQSNENKGNRKITFYYGDNIVPWNNNGTIYERYYYIFEDEEIKGLFQEAGLRLVKHFWNHGNEIYILQKDF